MVAHRGHAAILKVAAFLNISAANLKVAAILNNFLQTNKTCCMIKILATIACNVLQIEKNVVANTKSLSCKI